MTIPGEVTPPQIAASGRVGAPASAVYEFLAEPRNHRLLTGRRLRLIELSDADGGLMSGAMIIRGPFLIRRRADTRVIWTREPRLVAGVANLGTRTRAIVRWEIEPVGPGCTHVVLTADLRAVAPWDRVMLALGGRRWMRTLFSRAISQIDAELAPQRDAVISTAPEPVPVPGR